MVWIILDAYLSLVSWMFPRRGVFSSLCAPELMVPVPMDVTASITFVVRLCWKKQKASVETTTQETYDICKKATSQKEVYQNFESAVSGFVSISRWISHSLKASNLVKHGDCQYRCSFVKLVHAMESFHSLIYLGIVGVIMKIGNNEKVPLEDLEHYIPT